MYSETLMTHWECIWELKQILWNLWNFEKSLGAQLNQSFNKCLDSNSAHHTNTRWTIKHFQPRLFSVLAWMCPNVQITFRKNMIGWIWDVGTPTSTAVSNFGMNEDRDFDSMSLLSQTSQCSSGRIVKYFHKRRYLIFRHLMRQGTHTIDKV